MIYPRMPAFRSAILALSFALLAGFWPILSVAESKAGRVDVLESSVLAVLDQPDQYSLATLLGVAESERAYLEANAGQMHLGGLRLLRLAEFSKASPNKFDVIAEHVASDLKKVVEQSGVKMAYSAEYAERTVPPFGNMPRHFDPYWMRSKQAAFPLVAVVNRIDKKDSYPGTCGELRFVYRLAYYKAEMVRDEGGERKVETPSTLPLFLNVVYQYQADTNGQCQDLAKAWQETSTARPNTPEQAMAISTELSRGALRKNRISFKQVELNFQAVRYNSELKKDLGGQAVYLFRIFQEKEGKLAPVALENTINVAEILNDSTGQLKKDLLRQITDPANLEKIDNGTFVLDNRVGNLLANRALSLTTTGRARLANKPFTAIFGTNAEELAKVDYSKLKFIKSPQGLVERLNNNTCMGCHQAGGTAGFHLLGESQRFNLTFNRLSLPFSSHFGAERVRRQIYGEALAKGESAATFRPLSFFTAVKGVKADGLPSHRAARVRDLCLPDTKHFSSPLSCENGSACVQTMQNAKLGLAIGECVASPNVTPGHVCRMGIVTGTRIEKKWGDLYNLYGINDSVDSTKKFNEAGGCTVTEQGVPLGRISQACKPDSAEGRFEFVDKLTSAEEAPETVCAIQGGDAFDECARSKNPSLCLEKAKINRATLDSCSQSHFCREDFICQQLPMDVSRQYQDKLVAEKVRNRVTKLNKLGVGFCVPNYFMFNMRADGHIVPENRPARERP
jgi:hypothetical protein